MLSLEYRPVTFSQMAGQSLVKKSLLAISSDPTNSPRTILLEGKYGTGKCQPVDTIIPTPSGDKRFGDLQVGDKVFGSNGKPVTVLEVFPRGKKDVYRVHFRDGSYLDVGDDHLWTIETKTVDEFNDHKYLRRTITTSLLKEAIENNLELFPTGTHEHNSKYTSPCNCWIPIISQPLQYTDEHEPLCDPYVIGAFIATGGFIPTQEPKVYWTNSDQSVIIEMGHRCNLAIVNDNRHYIDDPSVIEALRYYNLLGKSHRDIDIPQDLFKMSPANRLLLVQGIMDSYGRPMVYNTGINQYIQYAYCTMSDQLASDFSRLITELGGYAINLKDKDGDFYKDANYVVIESNFNPFLASNWWDHFSRYQRSSEFLTNIRIPFKVEVLPPVEQQCIMVDAPDELYVADTKFTILTHNTTAARIFARALNCPNKQPNGDACGRPDCPVCGTDIQNTMYYEEYDSAIVGNAQSIRELRDTFYFGYDDKYKVIVLDEVQLISKTAQGALLKVLEEPMSSNIFFLLCTTDPDKLLPTIVSRSLELKYTLISKEDMVPFLRNVLTYNNVEITDKIDHYLDLIALRSHGHMRNAMMLLDSLLLLKDDFGEIIKDSTSEYEKFFSLAVSQAVRTMKKEEQATVCSGIVNKLHNYDMDLLQEDFEKIILRIINVVYGVARDPVFDNPYHGYIHSYKLVEILSDKIYTTMFTSTTYFNIGMTQLFFRLLEFK